MADNRIHNIEKLGRVVSFSGLSPIGTCTPSDADFLVEVGPKKKYMFGDFKEHGKRLPIGQQILIERHVDAFTYYGYRSVGFLAWHDPEQNPILAREAMIIQVYKDGEWKFFDEDPDRVFEISYNKFFGIPA